MNGANMTNLERYKADLAKLIVNGDDLFFMMSIECDPTILDKVDDKTKVIYKEKLPAFRSAYQSWYSEALAIIKILLPDRISDFIRYYEKPKNRKVLDYDNYSIEDYLIGLHSGRVSASVGIDLFRQQLNLLKACKKRFESSLFDIKQLLQADVFDSELEVAKELNKKGFSRAAGAMCGVILEGHFAQLLEKRAIKTKKHPTINEYNELLKAEHIISIEVFRFIQYLGDLRNKCDHKKDEEPTKDEINELIQGVEKIIKTVF